MNSNPVVAGLHIMKAKSGNSSAGTSGDDSGFDRLIKTTVKDSNDGGSDQKFSGVDASEANEAEYQLPNLPGADNTGLSAKLMLNPFAETRVQLTHQNRLDKTQGQALGDNSVFQKGSGESPMAGQETHRILVAERNVGLPNRAESAKSGLGARAPDAVTRLDHLPDEVPIRSNQDTQADQHTKVDHGRERPMRPDVLEVAAGLKGQSVAEPEAGEIGSKAPVSGDTAARSDKIASRSVGFDQQEAFVSYRAGDLQAGNAGRAISSLARTELGANTLQQNARVDARASTDNSRATVSAPAGTEVLSGVASEDGDGNRKPEITSSINSPTKDANRAVDDGVRATATTADVTKSGVNATSGGVPVPDPGAATQSQATTSLIRMIEANTSWTTHVRSPAVITNVVQGQDGKVLQSIRIHLHPVELGAVDATLRISGDKISLALKVDRESTQLSLMRDSQAIQNALRMSGYQVDEVIISGTNQDQGSEIGDQASRNSGAEPGEAGDQHRSERASFNDEDMGTENETNEVGQSTAADGVYI